ncbi:MAG: hypothetical protein R3Y28_06875 [Candidatus Gastranaerophilales bacterium]
MSNQELYQRLNKILEELVPQLRGTLDLSHDSRVKRYNLAVEIRQLYLELDLMDTPYWRSLYPNWNVLNEQRLTNDDIFFVIQNLKLVKNKFFTNYFDKIFISHSEKDKVYASNIISLLHDIGIKKPSDNDKEIIFCSSYSGYSIKNRTDNIEQIKSIFNSTDRVLALMLYSKNYFSSHACLNEIGAIWVSNIAYQPILLNGMEFEEVKGFLNPNITGFKVLDKFRLNDFKNEIGKYFNLPKIKENIWEHDRDDFINKVSNIV